ncbi:MAG TPA: heme-binding domain-containing protein [Silvibacterium sp.]|nr:heme-binding domain-containing protein [Silvibacterium sp.]
MAARHNLRTLIRLAGLVLLVFLGLQFVRPEIKNPPVTAELQAPPEVKQIFRNSCYNCHSNETKLAWFDQVVPAYWLVASDVKQARAHLNFSEIGAQPAAKQKGALYEAVNMIQMGAMPLPSYRMAHPHSAVTEEQLAVLRAYLNPPTPEAATPAADVQTADAEYDKWVNAGSTAASAPQPVQDEPNGVAFIPDYRNWHAISSTDRFDNHTMRVILGNDIAVKAIAENHINPWPDGTAFAKVAWHQQPDGQGFVKTGSFLQVEFMVRDSKKYASSKGWGWGRWLGTGLKPYGKDAAFENECISCHLPVRGNDYVYTVPIQGQQGGRQ